MSTNYLFGPDRQRVGAEDQEWAVWVSGLDDITGTATLAEALELANELNTAVADLHLRNLDIPPIMHAVVLHHGYVYAPHQAVT